MRRVIFAHVVSVDGFIEKPGETTWASSDSELLRHFIESEDGLDLHLYGRRAYERVVAAWPSVAQAGSMPEAFREYGRLWVAKPKVVFSRTLAAANLNTRLVRGDAVQEVRRLKEESGKDMLLHGANLAGALIRERLVDEFRLYVNPVALGSGKPMFDLPDRSLKLRLEGTRTFGCGVVLLRYLSA